MSFETSQLVNLGSSNEFAGPSNFASLNPTQELPKSAFESPSNKKFQKQFNQIFHEIDLYLDNSGNLNGSEKIRYHINPAAVMNITVTDTFNDWIVGGTMLFMYLPEDAPSSTELDLGQNSKVLYKGAKDNGDVLKSYQFRGDGYDLLRFHVRPLTKNNEGVADTLNINPLESKWNMAFLFSVYEVEDVSDIPNLSGPLTAYMKCLKLYFHDIRYQILRTSNLEYSTATSSYRTPNFQSGLANEGVLYTGDAIQDVMNECLGKLEIGGSLEFFQLGGDQDWDVGANELFYTSPAGWSAYDDVRYLYSHHVSKKALEGGINDLAVMHTKRPDNVGYLDKICLTPISDLFEKSTNGDDAGELMLEHFFVTSHSDSDPINKEKHSSYQLTYKSPNPIKTGDKVIKTFKYGQIISYSFVDMSPEINSMDFTTKPVYSVDIGKRNFNVKFSNNDVRTARKVLAEAYIKKVYQKSTTNVEELFLPSIHKSKEKSNFFPQFSLNGDNEMTRQKNGIHQLLYTGLFQNACICFKTLGLTIREAGSFIAIDKADGSREDDYNNKLYGQWFVMKVDHVFEGGAYLNVIYAIKIHRFKEKDLKFQETL